MKKIIRLGLILAPFAILIFFFDKLKELALRLKQAPGKAVTQLTPKQKLLKQYPEADQAIGINYRSLRNRKLPFRGTPLRSTLKDLQRFPTRQKPYENKYFKAINYDYSTTINHARILGYDV